ncbi:MAG TPA: DUF421 domain-containing protein [Papillibacter sp.]|nr:DUF421 domain-containing protein [Papillibacter sp.]
MAISIVRTLILYVSIITSMRIMGKRQIGELEPAELVVAVLISELAAQPLQDIGTPLIYGLVPAATLVICELLVSFGIVKSVKFRAFICGKPSVIIKDGQIIQQEMKKSRLTVDELAEQLRKKGVLDYSAVRYAILETDGKITPVLSTMHQPVTPKDMQLAVDEIGYPVIVINEGRVIEKNLQYLGLTPKWLEQQLHARNITSPEDVYVLTVDDFGRIYYALKEAT